MANSNSNTDSNIENKLPTIPLLEKIPNTKSPEILPSETLSNTTDMGTPKPNKSKVLPEDKDLPAMSLQHSDTFPALPNVNDINEQIKQIKSLDARKDIKPHALQDGVLNTIAGKKVDI